MAALRIVIVGAGIAGLACALACARAGAAAPITVLEAQAAPLRVPAHLDVVPNLLRDLARLGVATDCLRLGFAYNGAAVVDEQGERAFGIPTPRLAGERLPPALGMAYDDLLDILAGHAAAAGAHIGYGRRVQAIDAATGRLTLGDGATLAADLVVLATGAASPLAGALFGVARPGAAQAWWHALLPRPSGLDCSTWMAGGPGRKLQLVPIGMERAGLAVVRPLPVRGDSDATALARTLGAWGALPRRLAALLPSDAPTVVRVAGGSLLAGPWHRGAVLCVGACAHAVAPAFGQAAAQAVEDALVLGELVADGLPRERLLDRFMQRRGERAQRVHALAERAARWTAHPEPATDLVALADELGALLAASA